MKEPDDLCPQVGPGTANAFTEEPIREHDAGERETSVGSQFKNGTVDVSAIIDEDGNPVKQYPLPPHPHDRRNEFENTLMRAYMEARAEAMGDTPPERVYQSEFDRKFHMMLDNNWDRYQRLRTWATTSAPRGLRLFDKTHDGSTIHP